MRRSASVLLVALAAVILVACAPMRTERHHHHHGSPQVGTMAHGPFKDRMKYLRCAHACELWVHVAASGSSCTASVREGSSPTSDEVDVVVVRGNGTKTFSFRMATAGFEFDGTGPNSGVKIENDASDFSEGTNNAALRTRILARNAELQIYKYSVETKPAGARPCKTLDPMMINRD